MLQNLTKAKMAEYVILLVALVALGLSIAAVAKPCSSNFGDFLSNGKPGTIPVGKMECYGVTNGLPCNGATVDMVCEKGATCVNHACVNADKSPIGEQTCGSSNSGQPECCDPKEPNDCSSTAHGGDLQCVPDSRCSPGSGYSCQPGRKPKPGQKCTSMGNPCGDSDDPPCCSGLTCLGGECAQQSPGKKGTIGGGGGLPHLGNIGGGPGSTYNPDGSSNGDGGSPSPPSLKPDFPKFVFRGNKCILKPKVWGGPTYSSKLACEKAMGLIIGPGGQDSHPEPDGNISNNLPLILGITGGSIGAVILLVLAYLIMTKRLKL